MILRFSVGKKKCYERLLLSNETVGPCSVSDLYIVYVLYTQDEATGGGGSSDFASSMEVAPASASLVVIELSSNRQIVIESPFKIVTAVHIDF